MELRAYTPELTASRTFDADEVRIIPIGDIQYENESQSDIERLRKYIEWGMDNDCYFLGMGDYIDVASPSNRAAILRLRGSLYDSTRAMLDAAAKDVVNELADILEPTAGRWLGLLRGHHYWRFEDGNTSDEILADRLLTSTLGNCAMLALKIGKGAWNRIPVAWIWAHHGAGGGITPGVALNRLAHISRGFAADVYLMGHVHKTSIHTTPWLEGVIERGKPVLHDNPRVLMSVGGFLKGYEVGSVDLTGKPGGGYVERGMMLPHSLGTGVIKFRNADGRLDIGVELP